MHEACQAEDVGMARNRIERAFSQALERPQRVILLTCALAACLSPVASARNFLVSQSPSDVVLEFLDNKTNGVTLVGMLDAGDEAVTSPASRPLLQVNDEGQLTSWPFRRIRRIYFRGEEHLSVVSDRTAHCFSLGRGPAKIPAPPGWYDEKANLKHWQPVTYAHPNYSWFYIPGAAWIWSTTAWSNTEGETNLFRQAFTIPEDFHVVEAILSLTVDNQLDALYVNGEHVKQGPMSLKGQVVQFLVGPLLVTGKNALSVRASDVGGGQISFAGLAYRIDIWGFHKQGRVKEMPAPGVIVSVENGDMIQGELLELTPRTMLVATPYGKMQIDRDWVAQLVMNYEVPQQSPRSAKHSLLRRVLGRKSVLGMFEPQPHKPRALELAPHKQGEEPGLLMKTGEFVNGRLLEDKQETLIVKPRYGNSFAVPFSGIDSVFPNPPGAAEYRHYMPESYPYICCITMVNGDHISGLLDNMTGTHTTVKPLYSDAITINNNMLFTIDFPFNARLHTRDLLEARRAAGLGPIRIALIGDIENRKTEFEESFYYQAQRVLYDLGIQAQWLNAMEMVKPGVLTPSNFALLLNVDEKERYYHSVQRADDGFSALVQYVEKGGSLAHLAVATPFYFGYGAQQQRWLRVTQGNKLNHALGMDILLPGDERPGARPFELPDNENRMFRFVLNKESPYARYLPEEVPLGLIRDCRFRPITENSIPEGATFSSVYVLRDQSGASYGTAMAVIHYPEETFSGGFGFYISHLLLGSQFHGTSMIDYLLPRIVEIVLEKH
jgi:hypothetical protein